jgi:hypothetical protein
MPLLGLPDELLIAIANRLGSTYSHGSLANLNQACRRLRDVTVSALYRKMILFQTDPDRLQEDEVHELIGRGDPVPEAWRHTR